MNDTARFDLKQALLSLGIVLTPAFIACGATAVGAPLIADAINHKGVNKQQVIEILDSIKNSDEFIEYQGKQLLLLKADHDSKKISDETFSDKEAFYSSDECVVQYAQEFMNEAYNQYNQARKGLGGRIVEEISGASAMTIGCIWASAMVLDGECRQDLKYAWSDVEMWLDDMKKEIAKDKKSKKGGSEPTNA